MHPGRVLRSALLLFLGVFFVLGTPFLARAEAAGPQAGWREAADAGELVVLLRHAATTPGLGDPAAFTHDDCATQRNLSARGRAESAALGEAWRAAGVEFAQVRTSRWCRCRDTARLLGHATPEDWRVLDSFFRDGTTEAEQTAALRAWIAAPRPPGNALLVTHQVNITALTAIVPAMGEAVALRADPTAASGFRILARLTLTDLRGLSD